eukprot:TRINITY_DN13831_c0_g1_i1.p1 TRINITY_DN13831_c0_g1~~TRINITY_DN13831_c0_g1_i1.p1  ORF type:complete len:2102 (-),score=531.57 TRINITY_DN13831_c0_g1_i1:124-6258(-)
MSIYKEEPTVKLFNFFLNGEYPTEDLFFMLYLRHIAQKEFGLSLKSKTKVPPNPNVNMFRSKCVMPFPVHKMIPDGTRIVKLTPNGRDYLLQRALNGETLGSYMSGEFNEKGNLVTMEPPEEDEEDNNEFGKKTVTDLKKIKRMGEEKEPVGFGEGSVELSRFLHTVVLEFQNTPDDIIHSIKYNDDAEDASTIEQLQNTKQINSDITLQKDVVAGHEREVQQTRKKLEVAKRKGESEVSLHILENQLWQKEQEHSEAAIILKDLQKQESSIWESVQNMKLQKRKVHSKKRRDCGLSVSIQCKRFYEHVKRKFERSEVLRKAAALLAISFEDQMQDLEVRSALRIQRTFRRWVERKKALSMVAGEMEELQKQKMKRVRAARELAKKQHEKRLKQEEEHRKRLQSKQLQKEKEDKEKALRNRKRIQGHRRLLMEKKYKRYVRDTTTDIMRRWKAFVSLRKAKRDARHDQLTMYLRCWKGFVMFRKRRYDAARRIQNCFRCFRSRKQLVDLQIRMKRSLDLMRRFTGGQDLMLKRKAFGQFKKNRDTMRRVKAMLQKSLVSDQSRLFEKWQNWIKCLVEARTFVSISLSKLWRGYKGRQAFEEHKQRWFATIKIQNFCRACMSRFAVHEMMRKINNAKKMGRRLMLRDSFKAFSKWKYYARGRQQAKKRFRDQMEQNVASRFHRWQQYVTLWKAEVIHSRLVLQSFGRQVLAKRVKHYLASRLLVAMTLQKFFRGYKDRVIAARVKLLFVSARHIQRVGRGHLGRIKAKRRKISFMAATSIQKLWRGYCDRIKVWNMRVEHMLECAKLKNYGEVARFIDGGYLTVADAQGNSLLHKAVVGGSKRIMKLCLRKGMHMNITNILLETPLLHLCQAAGFPGQVELVDDILSKRGGNPNLGDIKGDTPLIKAIQFGSAELVKTLCLRRESAYYADVMQRDLLGLTPLHIACRENKSGMMLILLLNGADVNAIDFDGGSALHDACFANSLNCVKTICDWPYQCTQAHLNEYDVTFEDLVPVDLNLADNNGHTPLHFAAYSGFMEVATYLVHKGADMDYQDYTGRTPLHSASEQGFDDIVQLFCEFDANLDTVDGDMDTPLHSACRYGNSGVVKRLVEYCANPSILNSNGDQPLHIACKFGHVECVKVLLEYNVELHIKNFQHRTPLGEARFNMKQDIVEYFDTKYIIDTVHLTDEEIEAQKLMMGNVERRRSSIETGENPSVGFAALELSEVPSFITEAEDEEDESLVDGKQVPQIQEQGIPFDINEGNDDDKFFEGVDENELGELPPPVPVVALASIASARSATLDTVITVSARKNPLRDTKQSIDIRKNSIAARSTMSRSVANRSTALTDDLESTVGIEVREDGTLATRNMETFLASIQRDAVPGGQNLDPTVTGAQLALANIDAWEEQFNPTTGEVLYFCPTTGELTSKRPESYIPTTKKVWKIRPEKQEKDLVNQAEYLKDWKTDWEEIHLLRKRRTAAINIQKIYRAFAGRRYAEEYKDRVNCALLIQVHVRMWLAKRLLKMKKEQRAAAIVIQKWWSSRNLRRFFNAQMRAVAKSRKENAAATMIQKHYRQWKALVLYHNKWWKEKGVTCADDWQGVLQQYPVSRVWREIWAEHCITANPKVVFYENRLNCKCSWEQPPDWKLEDRTEYRQKFEMSTRGYTTEMWDSAVHLQRLFRGKRLRRVFNEIFKAKRVCENTLSAYLENPKKVERRFNYSLYVFTMERDIEKARKLSRSLYTAMLRRGPDVAPILYLYALVQIHTLEVDFSEAYQYIERAQALDPRRSVFKIAHLGFFRNAVLKFPTEPLALYNYALCLQIIVKDYEFAEVFYLRALETADRKLREIIIKNLSFMLRNFSFKSYDGYDAYRGHMQIKATEQAGLEHERLKQIELGKSARIIQAMVRGVQLRERVVLGIFASQLIPQQWQKAVDDSSDSIYYYSPITNQSRWSLPTFIEILSGLRNLSLTICNQVIPMKEQQEKYGIEHILEPHECPIDTEVLLGEALPWSNEWTRYIDDSGSAYFYNNVTGESSWERPPSNEKDKSEIET